MNVIRRRDRYHQLVVHCLVVSADYAKLHIRIHISGDMSCNLRNRARAHTAAHDKQVPRALGQSQFLFRRKAVLSFVELITHGYPRHNRLSEKAFLFPFFRQLFSRLKMIVKPGLVCSRGNHVIRFHAGRRHAKRKAVFRVRHHNRRENVRADYQVKLVVSDVFRHAVNSRVKKQQSFRTFRVKQIRVVPGGVKALGYEFREITVHETVPPRNHIRKRR